MSVQLSKCDDLQPPVAAPGPSGRLVLGLQHGGHHIDGLAAEEFANALREDGMLALARLQRKFRLIESPYRTPQTLVGGPRPRIELKSAAKTQLRMSCATYGRAVACHRIGTAERDCIRLTSVTEWRKLFRSA